MDTVVQAIRAFDKRCLGCMKNRRDVMISYSTRGFKGINEDLFLTQGQAMELVKEITKVVKRNGRIG